MLETYIEHVVMMLHSLLKDPIVVVDVMLVYFNQVQILY